MTVAGLRGREASISLHRRLRWSSTQVAFPGAHAHIDDPGLIRYKDHIIPEITWPTEPCRGPSARLAMMLSGPGSRRGDDWLSFLPRCPFPPGGRPDIDQVIMSRIRPLLLARPGNDILGSKRSELPWFMDPVTYEKPEGRYRRVLPLLLWWRRGEADFSSPASHHASRVDWVPRRETQGCHGPELGPRPSVW